ncbi:hypothetical protein EGR_08407 [Echinococcus granulosus]|uniref:Uncharacterized protein n=1 Tax=Echinococcus granulosus TaxID=6210 RepID=W6UTL9_ECHGR|nr:hypothetical protein EGR_08407 [Echinococcus granulosus]EUB56764.1 hypothetical protein EGR_08407 [Echinococcus granulosus]
MALKFFPTLWNEMIVSGNRKHFHARYCFSKGHTRKELEKPHYNSKFFHKVLEIVSSFKAWTQKKYTLCVYLTGRNQFKILTIGFGFLVPLNQQNHIPVALCGHRNE